MPATIRTTPAVARTFSVLAVVDLTSLPHSRRNSAPKALRSFSRYPWLPDAATVGTQAPVDALPPASAMTPPIEPGRRRRRGSASTPWTHLLSAEDGTRSRHVIMSSRHYVRCCAPVRIIPLPDGASLAGGTAPRLRSRLTPGARRLYAPALRGGDESVSAGCAQHRGGRGRGRRPGDRRHGDLRARPRALSARGAELRP